MGEVEKFEALASGAAARLAVWYGRFKGFVHWKEMPEEMPERFDVKALEVISMGYLVCCHRKPHG